MSRIRHDDRTKRCAAALTAMACSGLIVACGASGITAPNLSQSTSYAPNTTFPLTKTAPPAHVGGETSASAASGSQQSGIPTSTSSAALPTPTIVATSTAVTLANTATSLPVTSAESAAPTVVEANIGAAESGGALGAPTSEDVAAYWASDGCHYYAAGGQWYYDYCSRQRLDTNGQPISGQVEAWNVVTGEVTYVFDYTRAGYIAQYDYTDTLFTSGIVHWVAWPADQSLASADLEYQVTVDGSSVVWYTQQQMLDILGSGLGYRIGLPTPQQPSLTSDWLSQMDSGTTPMNGVLFGQQLNQTWFHPNCSGGCTTY